MTYRNHMKRLIYQFLFFTVLGLGTACSKSQSPEAPEKPAVPEPVVIQPPPASANKLIPLRLESANQTIVLSYLVNTNLLASVTDSKGLKITFNYKDAQGTGHVIQDNNEMYMNDYWWDTSKRINRVTRYQDNGMITPGGEYQIDYNELDQVAEVRYYSNKNQLLSSKNFTYDALANLTSLHLVEGGVKDQQAFTYDQKNGIFKYVPAAALLFLETDIDLFCSVNNNVIQRSGSTGNVTYHYEYQNDDFPSQVTVNRNGQATVFKISYKSF